jgi:hypothetical protein
VLYEKGRAVLEDVLDGLISSEPFERLLTARERPIVARAQAGADFVVAALARALDAPVLAVCTGPHEAEEYAAGVAAWLGPANVAAMPAWESLPYEGISPSPEIAARRHEAARRARHARGPFVLVVPTVAAMQANVSSLGRQEALVLERGGTVPPDELAERLAGRMPEERETVLVHGDYRLDNAILAPDGGIRAVLDWELCTVGDPLADVGLMIAYWGELGAAARLPDALFREPVTELPGFFTADELAEAYAEASGRDRSDLGFWVAFAYWRIAIIVEGIYRRWLNDPANGSNAGMLQPAVARLAGLARDALYVK